MIDTHRYPNHILTSYLAISHVWVSQENSDVYLWGIFGNLMNGDMSPIRIETEFETLHALLPYSDSPETEEIIEAISKGISEPSEEENGVIDISEPGGLHFLDHIFSLLVVYEENELGEVEEPDDAEELVYRLNGYVERKDLLPEFIEFEYPADNAARANYHNQLLAMQYHLYHEFSKTMKRDMALAFSNLTDPWYFEMAKFQYELKNG